MDTIFWTTDEYHVNNDETMNDFLDNINRLDIILIDGSYAEGVNSEGTRYAINVSGDGDFNHHKAEFEILPDDE